MSNVGAVFADRMVNVSITGPLIRIELAVFGPAEKQDGNPVLVSSQTLVMPLDGFAASFGMLDVVVKQLVDKGVLSKQDAPAKR